MANIELVRTSLRSQVVRELVGERVVDFLATSPPPKKVLGVELWPASLG